MVENKRLKVGPHVWKFKRIFGRPLMIFTDSFTGFDIAAFEDALYPNLPEGTSLKDAVLAEHGEDAVELIRCLLSI